MSIRRSALIALGSLLAGTVLFAQAPRAGMPSSAPWQVKQQENHALRQAPKTGALTPGRIARKEPPRVQSQPNHEVRRNIRQVRDARNIR
jgi:hypothetical protein